MPKRVLLSGNEAVATALRQINPDVFPAFPITPSTEIPQYFSNYVSNGLVDTEFITVESEHSSMSAAIGASAAGARALTATSSAGLAFMWEVLGVAASSRLPIALTAVCRALTGPLNINCDHSDTMGAKDSGWIQIYAENNQEAYDNMVMAYNIAENKDVRLPIMICQDGFIISHGIENVELIEDDKVKEFVGEYEPENSLINPNKAYSVGPYDTQHYYFEHKRQQIEAIKNAKQVILDVAKDFEALTGRKYGFFEEYEMEDAETAIIVINSTAGTAKDAIDKLRAEGKKVGLIKIRVFRPFPAEEIAEAIKNCKAVAIMDRSESFSNQGGPLGAEVMAAMYRAGLTTKAINIVYGLGGRDVKVNDIESVYADLDEIVATGNVGETYRLLGVRE